MRWLGAATSDGRSVSSSTAFVIALYYKRLYCKSAFLNDTFWMFLLSDMDECVIDIFRPLPVVVNDVYKSFYRFCV